MGEWLERKGYITVGVATVAEAVTHLQDGIAVVVTDLKMPRADGLEMLRLTREHAPHAAVILVSGFGTVDTAVTVLKEGAFDFLSKPVNLRELTHRIERALEKRAMAAESCQASCSTSAATWNSQHGWAERRHASSL